MADPRGMTFEETLLTRAAAAIAYPPTPAMRGRVLGAIGADDMAQRRRPQPRPVAMAAVAALAVVAAVSFAVALSVPGSRSAIAGFFGIEGSNVEPLPTLPPAVTPTPFPTPAGIQSIATPATEASASTAIGMPLVQPFGEEDPRAIYVVDYVESQAAILVFDEFDFWQSDLPAGFFDKGLPAGTTLREFTINGFPARWISGGNHIVTFIDSSGNEVVAAQRTIDRNTLVWRTDYAFYRIETDLAEADAVAIAETLP